MHTYPERKGADPSTQKPTPNTKTSENLILCKIAQSQYFCFTPQSSLKFFKNAMKHTDTHNDAVYLKGAMVCQITFPFNKKFSRKPVTLRRFKQFVLIAHRAELTALW